jgi:hypothetical protein
MALSYKEQLNHPLWIRKKQEILERDGFCCVICGSELHKLEVHHLCYFPDLLIWEYDNELMISVCGKHHTQLTYDLPKISGLIAFQCLKENIDLIIIQKLLSNLK